MQKEPHNHWALIIIIAVSIIFGVFWYSQEKNIEKSIPETISIVPHKTTPTENPNDLQASVEAITIPDYTDTQ